MRAKEVQPLNATPVTPQQGRGDMFAGSSAIFTELEAGVRGCGAAKCMISWSLDLCPVPLPAPRPTSDVPFGSLEPIRPAQTSSTKRTCTFNDLKTRSTVVLRPRTGMPTPVGMHCGRVF